MKSLLLDANALISFWTDRNEAQRRAVHDRLERATRDAVPIVILRHSVTEAVFVLLRVYGTSASLVRDLVVALLEAPSLTILDDPPLADVIRLWPDPVRDFGDAGLVLAARRPGIAVLTFDAALRRCLKREGVSLA